MTQESNEEFGSIPIAGDEGPSESPLKKRKKIKTPKPSRRRVSRKKTSQPWKWITASVLSIFLIYLLAGYFLFPYLLTSVFADKLTKEIKRPVTIAHAKFDPLRLILTLNNGIIGPRTDIPDDQIDPILSFSKLAINFEALGFLKRGIICKQLDADKLFIHLVRYPDSVYNITEIFGKNTATEKSHLSSILSGSFPFSFNNISLSNSKLLFNDQPAGKTHVVEEINLALPALSNFSYKAKQYIHPNFSAKINGSPVEMTGETSVEAGTLSAKMALQLKDLNLPSYLAYLPGKFDFTVTKGKGDLNLDIVFSTGSSVDTQLQIKGSGQLANVWLKDAEDNVSRISKAKFNGTFSPLAKKYHLKELTLNSPEIKLDKNPKGKWSLLAAQKTKSNSKQYDFEIDRLLVNNGKISFTDRFVKGGFADTWTDVHLSIDSLSSQKSKTEAPFAISGKNGDGTRITGQGKIMELPLLKAEGLMVIEQLNLSRLSPYINMQRDLQISSGFASKLSAQFAIDQQTGTVFSKMNVELNNLSLARKNQKWLQLPKLHIKEASINFSKKKIDLGQVESEKAYLMLAWDKKGALNWNEKRARAQAKGKKWTTTLNSLQLNEAIINLKDYSTTEPFDLQFDKVTIEAKMTDPNHKKGEIKGSAHIKSDGQLRFEGPMTTDPFSAELDCLLEKLPLANIQPLIGKWFTPTITEGILQAKGSFKFPDLTFSGETSIESFTANTLHTRDIVHWQSAIAQDINLNLDPFSLNISKIDVNKPFLNWILFDKNRSSLTKMFNSTPAKQRDKSSPSIDIRDIEIKDGKLAFADHIVPLTFSTTIPGVSGTIKNIQDKEGNRANFSLQGMVNGTSPLKLTGDFGFFDENFYTKFDSQITNLDILSLAAYIEPILGYQTEKGRVAISTSYQQSNSKINADNKVKIDGFQLGKRIDGNIQLPLTVAMYTDSNGEIEMDIPITGNTADPNFSFRSSLTKIFRNLLIKTAVSPYKLLTSLLPGEQKVDRLVFSQGEATLSKKNRKQLSTLASILAKRPLLNLKIKGYADSTCDQDAILAKLKQEAAQRHLEREARLTTELSQTYGSEEIIRSYPQELAEEIIPAEEPTFSEEKLQDKLKKLAQQRSINVQKYLVEKMEIDQKRLIVIEEKTISSGGDSGQCASRVDLIPDTSLQ